MVSGFRSRAEPPVAGGRGQSGSGFAVAESLVVTNAHVIQGCTDIQSSVGQLSIARVDRSNDLALLKAPVSLKVLPLRNRLSAVTGESVVALGFPLSGLLASERIVTSGIVSAAAGVGDDTRYVQVSAPIQPGNSGGPLLDASGLVIGVIVGKLDELAVFDRTGSIPQNVNFALAPATVRGFLESYGAVYATAVPSSPKSVVDIVSSARPSLVQIRCQ
jgi:S1-C subfamily serine protease